MAFSEAKPHRSKYPHGSEKGRVFVVTGGNSGIGFELCEILRSSGAIIYMASRSQASLPSHYLFYTSTSPTVKADQGGSRNQNYHLHLLSPQNRRQAQFPPSRSEWPALRQSGGHFLRLSRIQARGPLEQHRHWSQQL